MIVGRELRVGDEFWVLSFYCSPNIVSPAPNPFWTRVLGSRPSEWGAPDLSSFSSGIEAYGDKRWLWGWWHRGSPASRLSFQTCVG